MLLSEEFALLSVGKLTLTNTYAKKVTRLQERLDVIWILRNFVRVHYTTKEVPAVTPGVIEEGMTFEDILRLKGVNG